MRMLALAMWLCVGGCAAIHEYTWLEVSSAHFNVRSMSGERTTRQLSLELEQLRHAVTFLTGVQIEEPAVPTRVLVFDMASYRDLVRGDRLGVVLSTMRANWIAMADRHHNEETLQTIRHEYIHYLLHSQGGLMYPHWYDEGVASFLSTVHTHDGKIVIGEPPHDAARLDFAEWIPVATLVTSDDAESYRAKWQFYAESWALVHYLVWGRERQRAGDVADYLSSLDRGEPPAAAFTQAFGITLEQADREVYTYRTGRRLRVFELPDSASQELELQAQQARVRKLPSSEVAADLGELSFALHNSLRNMRALEYFRAAVASDPNVYRAHAGAGEVLAAQGDFSGAEASLKRAAELAPREPQLEISFAQQAFYRACAASTQAERGRWRKTARAHAIKAWKLDPQNAEAYAAYGATFNASDEPAEKGIAAMAHAVELRPANLELRFMLAQLYSNAKRYDEALRVLTHLETWLHEDEPLIAHVQRLLDKVVSERAAARAAGRSSN